MSELAGKYIVIEGNDGTGKSTQVERLASYLRSTGHDARIVEEPGSEDDEKTTPVANYLRSVIKNGSLLRDPEINLSLFSAARRELWQEKIAPALGQGATVLSARNYFSTFAYQGGGEGIDNEHIRAITSLFTHPRYMTPDHMLVLTLEDESVRAARISQRGALEVADTFESKDAEFQLRVNEAYVALAKEYDLPTISAKDNAGKLRTIEEIQLEIRQLLNIA
jgi:dTMP kinase